VNPTLNSPAGGRCRAAMAVRIDAVTAPIPPSGAPFPAMTQIIHTKNHAMLPTPPRRPGTASTSRSAAAVTASTGRVNSANGSSSGPGSMALDSPRASWRASAVTASTPAIEASTSRLLQNFPARYPALRSGVAARIWPTPVRRSRAMVPRTT
jgi:hypothetical protein